MFNWKKRRDGPRIVDYSSFYSSSGQAWVYFSCITISKNKTGAYGCQYVVMQERYTCRYAAVYTCSVESDEPGRNNGSPSPDPSSRVSAADGSISGEMLSICLWTKVYTSLVMLMSNLVRSNNCSDRPACEDCNDQSAHNKTTVNDFRVWTPHSVRAHSLKHESYEYPYCHAGLRLRAQPFSSLWKYGEQVLEKQTRSLSQIARKTRLE